MISNGASFGDSKNYGTNSLGIGPADILPSIYIRLLAIGGEIPWRVLGRRTASGLAARSGMCSWSAMSAAPWT